MRKFHLLFLIPAFLALPLTASAGEMKLSIQNGLVTLTAEDVPLSTIMAEWARVGQTRIVNGDKVSTPVSVRIVDMPERRALDILLRTVSGYIVAERPTPIAGASVFDRIMILPTSRAPLNTGPVNSPPPAFVVPRPVAPAIPDMDEEPVIQQQGVPQPNIPPGVPQPMIPGQQPAANPTAPLTAPRPGQLPPPAPQQPVPFGTPPPAPTKPGGGGGSGGGQL